MTHEGDSVGKLVAEYIEEFGELEIMEDKDPSGKTIPIGISDTIPNWLRTRISALLESAAREIESGKKDIDEDGNEFAGDPTRWPVSVGNWNAAKDEDAAIIRHLGTDV